MILQNNTGKPEGRKVLPSFRKNKRKGREKTMENKLINYTWKLLKKDLPTVYGETIAKELLELLKYFDRIGKNNAPCIIELKDNNGQIFIKEF